MKTPIKKPATTTVAAALTYQPPSFLGRQLVPVTPAHVVALEECDNALALLNAVPKTRAFLEALVLLALPPAEALAKAGKRPELAKEVDALLAQIRTDQLAELYRTIHAHYNHYFATQLLPENPPAPSDPAAGSAG